MAGTGLGDLTAGTRQTIGRYFSVVSMVPSLLFVVYAFLLVRSGAWSHHPNWGIALNALVHVGLGGSIVLIILGMLLGLALHPVQFSLVQFLEGYWGTTFVARKFRAARIARHCRRSAALDEREIEGDQEAGRLLAQYPKKSELVMPTRLGNVLRRYEVLAGQQYELNVLTVLPHIALAAQPEDVRYLDDQRTQLDLAVRMCVMALLASIMSVIVLFRDGSWLLVAIAPIGFSYISYCGAVISAQEYGVAMATLIDLNRFAFYERMRLPIPANIQEERRSNEKLMQLLGANSKHVFLHYKHPVPTEPAPPPK